MFKNIGKVKFAQSNIPEMGFAKIAFSSMQGIKLSIMLIPDKHTLPSLALY